MPIYRYTYDGVLLETYPDAASAAKWLIQNGIGESVDIVVKRMKRIHDASTRWYVPCIYEFRWSNIDFTGKRWPKIPKRLDIEGGDYIAAYLRRNMPDKSRTDIKRELTDLVDVTNMMMKVNRKLKEKTSSSPIYQFDLDTGVLLRTHDNNNCVLGWLVADGYNGTDLIGDFRNYLRKHNTVVGMFYGYMWSYSNNINDICGFQSKPIHRFSIDGKLLETHNNISEVVDWVVNSGLSSSFYWCIKNIKTSIKTGWKAYGFRWSHEKKVKLPAKERKYVGGEMNDVGIKVYRFSKSGDLLGEHIDRKNACDFVMKNNKYPITKMNSVRTLIAQALSGKAPSAFGYKWSYKLEFK